MAHLTPVEKHVMRMFVVGVSGSRIPRRPEEGEVMASLAEKGFLEPFTVSGGLTAYRLTTSGRETRLSDLR